MFYLGSLEAAKIKGSRHKLWKDWHKDMEDAA